MKSLLSLILLACIVLFLNLKLKSQETNPFKNRVINKYYSTEKLTQLQQDSYEEFKRVKYYFIHSFLLTNLNCSTCPPYLPAIFDVSSYEHLRLQSTPVEFIDSTKNAKIVLLSKNRLHELITTEIIPKISSDNNKFHAISNSPYPSLILTNNIENDFETFKTQLKQWAKYNPINFFELKSSNKKIFTVEELIEFPTDKIQHIIDNPQLYLILSNKL